jgi:hypothetical protein
MSWACSVLLLLLLLLLCVGFEFCFSFVVLFYVGFWGHGLAVPVCVLDVPFCNWWLFLFCVLVVVCFFRLH